MPRVLLTGMSGAGKTTVLDELRRRGHLTVDTDYDGWELPGGTWDEERMAALLAAEPDVVVSGTVSNQRRFYDRFEHVVLLSAPVEVLLERVRRRTKQPVRGDRGAAGRDRGVHAHGRATAAGRRHRRARRTAAGVGAGRRGRGDGPGLTIQPRRVPCFFGGSGKNMLVRSAYSGYPSRCIIVFSSSLAPVAKTRK